MNEHDMYVRLQKYIESLKEQIEGLVKERDLLLEENKELQKFIGKEINNDNPAL